MIPKFLDYLLGPSYKTSLVGLALFVATFVSTCSDVKTKYPNLAFAGAVYLGLRFAKDGAK